MAKKTSSRSGVGSGVGWLVAGGLSLLALLLVRSSEALPVTGAGGRTIQPPKGDAPTPLTEASFPAYVAKGTGKKLVTVTADWCPACAAQKPVLGDVAKAGVPIGILDETNQGPLLASLQVSALPTTLVVKDGVILSRVVGGKTKQELLALYQSVS